MAVIIDGNNTPTAGGIGYGDGSELAFTSAGSSGQVLTSAGSGTPTWSAPPASGLTFISSQTISSTVASMDFTSGISSTYDSYFVVFSNFQIQNGGRIALRLRQGSTFVTSGYATYFFSVQNGNVFNANFETNATFLMSNQSGTPDNAGYSSGYFTLLSANIATARVAAVNGYSSTAGNNGSSSTIQNFSGGLTSTGVITGFQFLSQSGNLNGGTATLYGMAKS